VLAALAAEDVLTLDARGLIDAADPVSGEPVRVTLTSGVASWQPQSAVVFYGARAGFGPSAAVCC
jgi:hypothetical protein